MQLAAGSIHGDPSTKRGLLLLGLGGYPGAITLSITTREGDVGIDLTQDRCFYGLINIPGDRGQRLGAVNQPHRGSREQAQQAGSRQDSCCSAGVVSYLQSGWQRQSHFSIV